MTENRQALLSKADSAAAKFLREKYAEEFANVKQVEAAKLGVEWTPRPTPAQAARQEVARLLKDFPEVQEELIRQIKGE